MSHSKYNRAANTPRLAGMALGLVMVATSGFAAHDRTAPTPAANAGVADQQPSTKAAVAERRASRAARSGDRSHAPGAKKQAKRHAKQRVKRAATLTRKPIPQAAPKVSRVIPVIAARPIASSNAAETVASARASTRNEPGMCLAWSRQQADIPAGHPDAATAWHNATGRHHDSTPPKGSAVYWTGGSSGFGHIAISVGNGMVRSTDAGGSGVVATVSIDSLTREWNLSYAGWANTINGYQIPGVARV